MTAEYPLEDIEITLEALPLISFFWLNGEKWTRHSEKFTKIITGADRKKIVAVFKEHNIERQEVNWFEFKRCFYGGMEIEDKFRTLKVCLTKNGEMFDMSEEQANALIGDTREEI